VSEKKELKRGKNKPSYVRVEDCLAQHTQVSNEVRALNVDVKKIVNTLLGEEQPGSLERKGGLVVEIRGIKEGMKSRLSGRDKAGIIGAVVMAISAIIVALLK